MCRHHRYIVEASGHGSDFVRENPPTLLLWDEAKRQADHWESIADTIGGRARVIDSHSGLIVYQDGKEVSNV